MGYHPFLNAKQQSGEMIDALTAGRTALPATFAAATTDSGKLYITGYSEGGYVAMATQRAMENAALPVTAAAPASGPYALEALFDTVLFGHVDIGSTLFSPLVTTSYQHAYNNVYNQTSDFYSPTYASGVDTLLPSAMSTTALEQQGLLPQLALFDSTTPTVTVNGNGAESAALTTALQIPTNAGPLTALFDAGFGNPYLINNSVRISYAIDVASNPDGVEVGTSALAVNAPTYGLRLDLYTNDLRNGGWVPSAPTLMCGGSNDPTVFFSVDTLTMASFWSNVTTPAISVLDVDPAAGPSGLYALIQAAFQSTEAQELAFLQTPAGGGLSALAAEIQIIENYHGSVAPFCALAARTFFQSVP